MAVSVTILLLPACAWFTPALHYDESSSVLSFVPQKLDFLPPGEPVLEVQRWHGGDGLKVYTSCAKDKEEKAYLICRKGIKCVKTSPFRFYIDDDMQMTFWYPRETHTLDFCNGESWLLGMNSFPIFDSSSTFFSMTDATGSRIYKIGAANEVVFGLDVVRIVHLAPYDGKLYVIGHGAESDPVDQTHWRLELFTYDLDQNRLVSRTLLDAQGLLIDFDPKTMRCIVDTGGDVISRTYLYDINSGRRTHLTRGALHVFATKSLAQSFEKLAAHSR